MDLSKLVASLPNLITIARLVLVPVIVALMAHQRWEAVLATFVVAGLSDAADGFIAKRFKLQTELGAYLDPVADKALLISIYVMLAAVGVLPDWLAILVVFRDVMIVGGVVMAAFLGKPVTIRPLLISKANTTAQIGFAALVLAAKAFGLGLGLWFGLAIVVVATLTVASAAAYLAQWLDHMGK
jgi:cardiolipin synthase